MIDAPLSGKEAVLQFRPVSAALGLRHQQDVSNPRTIEMALRLNDHLDFSGGATLRDSEWNMVVDEGNFHHNAQAAALGVLGFMNGPNSGKEEDFERGFLMCAIGPSAFEALLVSLLHGRLPKVVQIHFDSVGMTEGEGYRRTIWNIEHDPSPRVVGVYFHTPLIEAPDGGEV